MSKTLLPQKVTTNPRSKQPCKLLKQNCKVMVKMPLFTWLHSQSQTERTPSIGYIPTLKIATHTLRQSKSGETVWTMAPWNLERPLAIFIIIYLISQHFLLTWEMQSGDEIKWSELARHFQLQTTTGTTPSNSGQVIQECAKSQRIDVSNFNKDRHVSVQDEPRIRVPKKKISIIVGQTKHTGSHTEWKIHFPDKWWYLCSRGIWWYRYWDSQWLPMRSSINR